LVEVGKPSIIRRRMDSISVVHQLAGFESPTTDAAVLAGGVEGPPSDQGDGVGEEEGGAHDDDQCSWWRH
jgi:hypothetical protein